MFVISDKVGWFRWGLEKTLGIKPFRKFNIPVFARVDKAIDAFVKEKWYTKVFGIFWEVVCIFQGKYHKVAANDFSLEVGSNEVSTFEYASGRAGGG